MNHSLLHRWLVLLVFPIALCLATPELRAESQAPVPNPGPEHKRLEILAGTWAYEGQTSETPLGPKEKFKGKLTSRFILDGFFLETRWEEKNPTGLAQGVEIHGYDAAAQQYRTYMFGNDGSQMIGTDTDIGDGIQFEYQMTDAKGRKMLAKAAATFTPDHRQFTSRWQLSVDGGKTWMPFMEYTGKKIGK